MNFKNGKKNIEVPLKSLENSKYVFEVFFSKSIYFPMQIKNKQSLNDLNKTNLVIYGFYYGFIFVVLLINLFFLKQTKEQFFLYFILLTLSIGLILFELDGFVYLIFGSQKWVLYIDVFYIHFCLLV